MVTRLVALLSVSFVGLASGCGPSVGRIEGAVSYKGKNLAQGNVTFMPSQGMALVGAIRSDGSYVIENVPVGLGKFAVASMDPGMSDTLKAATGRGPANVKGRVNLPVTASGQPKLPASFSLIPERYVDFDASGLTLDVKSGTNRYDILLVE